MLQLQIIARARNGFSDKFGIPRQSREHSVLQTRIVFEPAFRLPDALRGIERCSHLWILWGFSQNPAERPWHATVRPPRLGGNTRVGVFATRSPFRPNPIGLTSVRLLRVEHTPSEGTVLIVSGADMLDGTPVYDIKPYLHYTDSHSDANNGIMNDIPDRSLHVVWRCPVPENLRAELTEILAQDPRPAYQNDPQRLYRLDYVGCNLAFRVDNDTLIVEILSVSKCFENT